MLTHLTLWTFLAFSLFNNLNELPSSFQHSDPSPAARVHAAVTAGPATPSSKPGTSQCLEGVINAYTPVLGFGCDSSTLQVGPLNGFAPGDKVLLIQMQVAQVDLSNTASFGTPLQTTCIGNYEFNRIQSIAGNQVQLQFALIRPYDLSGRVQLVRVPEYDNATVCNLTCQPWNGTTGGILALDVANQLILSGHADVSGKGFRGGQVENNIIPWVFGETQYFYAPVTTHAAAKGEGVVLIPPTHSFGRGRAGNGGGGGNAHNGGGGGGANAGAGGNGGLEITNLPASPTPNTDGIGGLKFFDNSTTKVLLGGGAGAGHANDAVGSAGGNGGGIMFVTAATLQTNGFKLLANGQSVPGGVEHNDGQGGGGGGGTILLKVAQINGTLPCELKGGGGGSNPYTPAFQLHGPGGGGGGGKLVVVNYAPNIVSSVVGGANGLTSQGLTNGAAPGVAGKVLSGLVLQQGTQPAQPVSSNFSIQAQSPSCGGPAGGQIEILQSTATAYSLNGGPWQSQPLFTGLAAGTYQLALQFAGGCTLDTTVVLTLSPPVTQTLVGLSGAGCNQPSQLTVAGGAGTPPYQYQVDGGPWQPTGGFLNLSPGPHAATVQDAAGCTHSATYSIPPATAPGPPTLAITQDCSAGGTIEVVQSTATAFSLNGGPWQSQPLFSNLAAGTYTVGLQFPGGCVQDTAVTLAAPAPVLDSLILLAGAACNTGGQLEVTGISGLAPFEYQLDGGAWQPGGLFSDLAAGPHQLTIRDAAGCTHISAYIVPPPGPLPPPAVLISQDCITGGQIEVLPSTAAAFSLNGGPWQAQPLFAGLAPGDYIVGLQYPGGCVQDTQITLAFLPAVQDSLVQLVGAGCTTGGQIEVVATAGTGPFEFQLDGGPWQASGLFTNLPAGTYQVAVRDAGGCSQVASYTVEPPPALNPPVLLVSQSCTAGGQIELLLPSATSFSLNGGPWQSQPLFAGLAPGAYTVALQHPNGCIQDTLVTLPSLPPVADSLIQLLPATCDQGGQLECMAISGQPPFEFQLDGGPWQPSGLFSDLPAGPYLLTVRDASGCTAAHSYVVDPPPPPDPPVCTLTPDCAGNGQIALAQPAAIAFSLNGGAWQAQPLFSGLAPGTYQLGLQFPGGCLLDTTVTLPALPPVSLNLIAVSGETCTDGGQIEVSGQAGTPPYEYQLDGGAWQSGGLFTDLPAGPHALTIRDAAGCTHDASYSVPPSVAVLDSLVELVDESCTAPGRLTVVGTIGTPPFEFQLDGGAWQPSGQFTGLAPGTYQVTVRDAVGCLHASLYTVAPAPVPAPPSLVVNPGCDPGGQIEVIQPAASAYSLNGGPWQAQPVFSDLPAGTYQLGLEFPDGCMLDTVAVLPPLPPVLDSLIGLAGETCSEGGQLEVTAVSGTPPFEYQLDGGAWQPDGVFNGLLSGTHSLAVRDAEGCLFENSYTVAPSLAVLDTLLSLTGETCTEGGQLTVAASIGQPPFEFQLDGGAWQSAGTFSGLPAGPHLITVRDAAGCTHSSTYTIAPPPAPEMPQLLLTPGCAENGTIEIQQPAASLFNLNGGPWQSQPVFTGLAPGAYTVGVQFPDGCLLDTAVVLAALPGVSVMLELLSHATCTAGGHLTLSGVSGTPPFEYQLDGGVWQPTGVFTGLSAGAHQVIVRDAAGCQHSGTYGIGAPPVPAPPVISVEPDCGENGQISVAQSAALAFSLNGGPWQSQPWFGGLAPGTYQLSLQFPGDCLLDTAIVLPALPAVSDTLLLLLNAGCHDGGQLTVSASAGTPPYQFQLDNGPWQSNGNFYDLPAGTYLLTVRDARGCTHQATYPILGPEPVALALDTVGHVHCGAASGFLTVTASGGSGPYTYSLENAAASPSGNFSGLEPGQYTVIATDSEGCEVILEDLVIQNQVDSARTFETVTLYEGGSYTLPDGRTTHLPGLFPFHHQTWQGCDSLHLVEVVILKRKVYVPNVFLPGDNGLNGNFTVYSDESLEIVRRLQVFDRWGDLVFEADELPPNQPGQGWDGSWRGRPMNPGLFVWMADLEFIDGFRVTLWGDVTVVR
jgi:hypothetical protein